MGAKILTLIVPSFNMERYLPQCLGSLIVDDVSLLKKVDVIVVNDGSTDGTSKIAHDFASRYPDVIRVIDKPNGHYGSCINAALPLAQGRFVKVLDADDSFDREGFTGFIRFLTEVGDVDLVTSDYVIVDEQGNVTSRVDLPYPNQKQFDMRDLADAHHELIMHAVAYRTQMLIEMGYRQTEGCVFTDTEWMFRPMLRVRKIVRFAKPVYRYLVGRAGQSVDPQEAVRLLPAQIKIFNNILEVYKAEKQNATAPCVEYMEMYIGRIYRILLIVFFDATEYDRVLKEFLPIRERVQLIAPNCLRMTGNYGVLFPRYQHVINCVTLWLKNPKSPFWMYVWRAYLVLRKYI